MSEQIENNEENSGADPSPSFAPDVLARLEAIKATLASRKEDESPIEEIIAEETKVADSNKPITGADVAWEEYDLPYNIRHLYPQATLRETQDGPKWVAIITEFYSADLSVGAHGKIRQNGQLCNLGEYLTKKLMDGEGWKISGIIPSSLGMVALLLERPQPLVLPDPVPLEKVTTVPPVTEPELAIEENKALAWANALTGPEASGNIAVEGADWGLDA